MCTGASLSHTASNRVEPPSYLVPTYRSAPPAHVSVAPLAGTLDFLYAPAAPRSCTATAPRADVDAGRLRAVSRRVLPHGYVRLVGCGLICWVNAELAPLLIYAPRGILHDALLVLRRVASRLGPPPVIVLPLIIRVFGRAVNGGLVLGVLVLVSVSVES